MVRSLTAEIGGVRDEFRLITEQIMGMQTVRKERADALAQQQDLLQSIQATAKDREELEGLQALAAVLGVQSSVYERTATTLSNFRGELLRILDGIGEVAEWPASAGENDLVVGVRARIAEALGTLRTTVGIVEIAEAEVRRLTEQNGADRLVTDDKARGSRRALDALQAGAGALARQVEILTEREAQLNTLGDLASDRAKKVARTPTPSFRSLQGTRKP